MISIDHVSKEFSGGKVKAVRDINFQIQDNEIFCLLGPNGAGKTTLMRMMSTLLTPSSGEIVYDGKSVRTDQVEIKRRIGFLTNEIRLEGQLTPRESALFYGSLYGMHEDEIIRNMRKLFDYFGIAGYEDRKYASFSTGMKQKASIAICLIHDPEIIIFDEPTNGLDVITQKLVEDYIKKACHEDGKCLIISTHLMDIVERLADRVGVIIDGNSVFCGTCEEMIRSQDASSLSDAFVSIYQKNHLTERDENA